MKIYLFDPETGIYQGEDFADENPRQCGGFELPPDATAIAPPRVGQGEVPVFNRTAQCWEVCERPATARKSFYDRLAGSSSSGVSV